MPCHQRVPSDRLSSVRPPERLRVSPLHSPSLSATLYCLKYFFSRNLLLIPYSTSGTAVGMVWFLYPIFGHFEGRESGMHLGWGTHAKAETHTPLPCSILPVIQVRVHLYAFKRHLHSCTLSHKVEYPIAHVAIRNAVRASVQAVMLSWHDQPHEHGLMLLGPGL